MKRQLEKFIDNVNGRIAVPILLFFLSVPATVLLFLWAFFFPAR